MRPRGYAAVPVLRDRVQLSACCRVIKATPHNMNTNSLPALSFLAVLTASIFLPVSAGAACIALTICGVAAVLVSDYGREQAPIQTAANVITVDFSSRNSAGIGKAA